MEKFSLIPIREMEVIEDEMLNFITAGFVQSMDCVLDQCRNNTGNCSDTNQCHGNQRDCTVNSCIQNNKDSDSENTDNNGEKPNQP